MEGDSLSLLYMAAKKQNQDEICGVNIKEI